MTSPHQQGQQTPPGNAPPSTTNGSGRPTGKAPATPGRRLAVIVAVVAVLLALASAVVSWQASSRAGDALDEVAELRAELRAAPEPQPTGPPPTEPAVQPTPADEVSPGSDPDPSDVAEPPPSGSDPVLTKETEFEVRYTAETLRIPVDCANTSYIDLDEPRVRVDSALAEFRFYDPCGPASTPTISLSDGVRGSVTDTDGVTPGECVDLIRSSPLSDERQPLQKGQGYCVNTSRSAATESATTWKMVILRISAIAQDGTVTIEASAWTIPD